MNNQYIAEPAVMGDLKAIMQIFAQAREFMSGLGNPQWQDGFPGESFIADKISRGIMYKIMCGGSLAAVFSVLDYDEDYDVIDGKWLTDGNYFVLHTVAVARAFRGKGCARFIFAEAEAMAAARGKISVRMDTHEQNVPMRTLVDCLGYTFCGKLNVCGGKPRIGFEKLI